MSDENKFSYHRHLVPVALADVDVLLKKDTSYGASWKKSGGRSAWFMLVRMMDRLNSMMAPPVEPENFNLERLTEDIPQADETNCTFPALIIRHLRDSYVASDIFKGIEAQPGGEDGTVIAVLRDLRRYALLVEAELIERNILPAPLVARVMATERPLLDVWSDDLRVAYKGKGFVITKAEIEDNLALKAFQERLTELLRGSKTVPLEDSNKHADRYVEK